MRIGAIEAGGTKFVVAVGNEQGKIFEKKIIPTKTPQITMKQVTEFFLEHERREKLSSLGIASFGPLNIQPKSKDYGKIEKTPKLAWQDFNYVKWFKRFFSFPIFVNTDVNGAAVGEKIWGAAKNLNSFLYMTVGTGIGVGGMVLDQFIMGLSHSEMGHIFVPIHPEDSFKGVCPFHKNCLEGLASGPSLLKRWKVSSPKELPRSHLAWKLEAYYLGTAIANYILCFSPERVIVGGGVMNNLFLFDQIRKVVLKRLSGYLHSSEILKHTARYIQKPKLKENAGVLGAMALVIQGKKA